MTEFIVLVLMQIFQNL